MNCSKFNEVLMDYLSRTLPVSQQSEADAHCAACAACSAAASETESTERLLRGLTPVPAPDFVWTRVKARIEEISVARPVLGWTAKIATAAAACLIAFAGVYFSTRSIPDLKPANQVVVGEIRPAIDGDLDDDATGPEPEK